MSTLIANGYYPFFFHGPGARTAFPTYDHPTNPAQIDVPNVFQQRLNRQKTDYRIGILQIFDARETVLSIFDAHSPPNVRLVSRKPQLRIQKLSETLGALREDLIGMPFCQHH